MSIVAIAPLLAKITIDEDVFGKNDIIDGDEFENLVSHQTLGVSPIPRRPYNPPINTIRPIRSIRPLQTSGGTSGVSMSQIGGVQSVGVGTGSSTIPSGEGTWGGGGFGESGWGIGGGGFGGSGWGTEDGGGETETETETVALGVDELGCPIYGYDENGTALYGLDQAGNVITDPSVLPCAMKIKEGIKDKPVKKDRTLLYLLLAVGAVAVYATIKK